MRQLISGVIVSIIKLSNFCHGVIIVTSVIMAGRCRLSIHEDRKGNSVAWLILSTFCAELVGTALLMFLGCMGEAYGFKTTVTVDMQGGIVFGVAVLIIIQTFGPVSGAHVNPAVTLAEWIVGIISLPLAIFYVIAQLLGALAGTGLLWLITSEEILLSSAKGNGTFCVVGPSDQLTLTQSFFAEFLASFILILFCLGCWDKRNELHTDSIGIKFALVVAALSMAGGPYSGASMNPARAFGPAVIFNEWGSHWVYWVAPLAAAIIAVLMHIAIFEERANTKRSDEENGNNNKKKKEDDERY